MNTIQPNAAQPGPPLDRRPRPNWRAALPLLVLLGLALLVMWPSTLGGRVFLPLDILPHLQPWRYSYERVVVNNPSNSDLIQQIYPRRLLANEVLAQGAWPLWNPTILTGTPLLADGQLALLYPPSILFLLLSLARAFGVYALCQLVLGGAGGYLFARRLGLDRPPALIAGVCTMFGGFAFAWLQFPEFSAATALVPWCFWAVDRACARRTFESWVLAGLVLALPLVAQLQLAFYAYVGVGCYVLVQLVRAHGWRERGRIAAGFALALVAALGLSAAQLLPQAALSAEGQRPTIAVATATPEAQFHRLLRLGLPLVDGQPRSAPIPWRPALLQTPDSYVGLLPLLLALVALVWSRRRDSTLFGLLALGSFALASGSPALKLFATLVPPYRQFADHSRWLVLWSFSVAVLAGMGAQTLLYGERPQVGRVRLRNRSLLALVAVVLAIAAWQYLALFTPGSRYGAYITLIRQQPLLLPLLTVAGSVLALLLARVRRVPRVVAGGLLLGIAAADLAWYGATYNTQASPALFQPTADLTAGLAAQGAAPSRATLYPPTRQTAFLLAQPGPFRILGAEYGALPPNVAAAYGLEDVRGYQSLYLARYNRLARLIDGKDPAQLGTDAASFRSYFTTAAGQRRLLDMLNVAYLVFPPGSTQPETFGPLELAHQSDEGTIYRNPAALPRAWLVHAAEVIPDDAAQLQRLAEPSFAPTVSAIVAQAVAALEPARAPEATPGVEYAPNTVRVTAAPSAAALLVLADAYADGWSVTVDGQPAELVRANYALRGVRLPAGEHQIVFRYDPPAFRIGLAVSLGTLVLGLGSITWRTAGRRRSQARGSGVR